MNELLTMSALRFRVEVLPRMLPRDAANGDAMGMTATAQDRLRDYLHALPASLRERLAAAAGDALASGTADEALRLIAWVLEMPASATAGAQPVGPAPPLRERFEVFMAPFVSRGRSAEGFDGYIGGRTASRLWDWLVARAGDETREALRAAEAAAGVAAADAADAQLLARMADDVESRLLSARGDRTLAFQIQTELGGTHALRELGDFVGICRMAPQLTWFRPLLPAGIPKIDEALCEQLMQLVAALPAERLRIAAQRIAAALEVPARVVGMAARLEGTDNARRIARGRWAPVVEVAITRAAIAADRVAAAPRPCDLDEFLEDTRQAHLAIQAITRTLEVENWPRWHDRLAECRRRISGRLSAELAELPMMLRHVIGGCVGEDRDAGIDKTDAEEVLRMLRLLHALKAYRGELAVSDLVERMLRLVESLMENANQMLLSVLRSDRRRAAVDGCDTLVGISAIVFGDDYAGLLRRSAHMASEGTAFGAAPAAPALAG